MKNKKANKNSIVRIIISKFDNKSIKEIKVLYNKQGGVDTFTTETKVKDGKVVFTTFKEKKREFSDDFEISPRDIESTEKEVIKRVNGKITRQYRISGKINKKNPQEIILKVEDIGENNKKIEKRRRESETKRLLLDEELMERYAQIADCNIDKIDSQKIYKIKRFLSYRSNMLIYFQFINDFLTKGIKINKNNTEKQIEVWEFLKDYNYKDMPDEEIGEKDFRFGVIRKTFEKYVHVGIENYNNRRIKELKKKKKYVSKKDIEIATINPTEENKLLEDINNLIRLFIELRHKLMHYDYKFFEELFDNSNPEIEFEKGINKNLNEVLNLNIFEGIKKLKGLKEENKNNYLTDKDTIRVLGKEKNAQKIYTTYNMICNRQNGFNKFINSFFSEDGLENDDLKLEIKEHFEKRIKHLKDALETGKINDRELDSKELETIEKELNEKQEFFDKTNEPYVWDIHQCRIYKDLYIKRKKLAQKQSELTSQGVNKDTKNEITKLNKELFEIKKGMEKLTKANSKIKLEYKLQLAFGFLIYNFNKPSKINATNEEKKHIKIDGTAIDIYSFKNKFDSSKLEEIEEYKKNWKKYLYLNKKSLKKELPIDLNLGVIERNIGSPKNIFDNLPENNLSKFYIIMYLLIPVEMRGDFLGFVKKHYYDIKNIDFIEIKGEKKLEEDVFFQNLRLFEKNTRDFEIIKYGIVDYNNLRSDFDKIYSQFGLSIEATKYLVETNKDSKEKRVAGLFDKNIILPIMKYYQYIFKLLNDIEIHALVKLRDMSGLDLDDCIKLAKSDDFPNFVTLMKKVEYGESAPNDKKEFIDWYKNNVDSKLSKNKIKKLFDIYGIRNSIAHLDFKNLFIDNLSGNVSISAKVDTIIEKIKENKIDEDLLGTNFINDFYQKKEQFIFNQRLIEQGEPLSPNKQKEKEEIISLLNSNNIIKLRKEDFLDKELVLDEDTLEKVLKKSKKLMLISQKSFIAESDKKEIKGMEVFLSKNSKGPIGKVSINRDNVSKVQGRVALESSNLLGVYKKYTIKNLKTKLINLFVKGEKRYINLDLYNKSLFDKKVEEGGQSILDSLLKHKVDFPLKLNELVNFIDKEQFEEIEKVKRFEEKEEITEKEFKNIVGKFEAKKYFVDNNLNSTKKNEIELTFVESCGKSWHKVDFEARFDWAEEKVKEILDEKGLRGYIKFDNTSHVLTYESKYKNAKKKRHNRNILTGIMKNEKKDMEKGNNFGLYIQKIKGLY